MAMGSPPVSFVTAMLEGSWLDSHAGGQCLDSPEDLTPPWLACMATSSRLNSEHLLLTEA